MKSLPVVLAAALLAGDLSAQIDVQVSPANAFPGQTITVSLTNNSNQTYTLPTLCVFRSVHETGCGAPAVLSLFCGGSLVPVGPGHTKTQTWDQTDDFGQPVASGTYAFGGFIYDPNFSKVEFCAQVEIASCATPPTHYGPASAGTGDVEPKLGRRGEPQVGNANFELQLADTVGGANALFLVGIADPNGTPVGWGTFLLDPNFPVLSSPVIAMPGPPGVAGAGFLTLLAGIPNDTSLIGGAASLQLVAVDVNSVGGLSHSEGMTITVCP
ncbi:MAG: hypothetical protein ACF8XB_06415 [Planctomycetota bacterium JB042]